MLLDNHQMLHHKFFEFCIYQANIITTNNITKQLCHIFLEFHVEQEENQIQKFSINQFITHLLILVEFRNKF